MMGRPSATPGKVVAVALVANLFLASAGAFVFAPVWTTETLLAGYDGLPSGLRGLLGDETETDGADRVAGSGAERGPVGDWLESWYLEAVRGDRAAQLSFPLAPRADLPAEVWVTNQTVGLRWQGFVDSDLRYRVAATGSALAPDLAAYAPTTVAVPEARVPLSEGSTWVHVQAVRDGATGPVATVGPFLGDPSPPVAPSLGPDRTVEDFHFTLSWPAATDLSGITGYVVELSRNGADWERIGGAAAGTTVWEERNRPNGEYLYRVRAINGAGVESEPTPGTRIVVDARTNLSPPAAGTWHFGINATYDSVVHVWDISDPSVYVTLDDLQAPGHGGLTQAEYDRYLSPGWGVTLDNQTLRRTVADELGAVYENGRLRGGERNALVVGMTLYEWLFNATDYDFDKFAGASTDFLKANETLDRGLGICGDLTSLFITMMRIAGVPARPVHGYLINEPDPSEQFAQAIGGFHMWAEIYVGGQDNDPTGDGWIPVDVSGVTGTFEPKFLDIYFGVANPSYLQLGIQEDLGDPDDPEDPANKWNVWANLQWQYSSSGPEPTITFDADARLTEVTSTRGRLWFDPVTHERAYCASDDTVCREGFRQYFEGLKGRSVRHMDYGADLSWDADNVERLWLKLKYPEATAPNQVQIHTAYRHDARCQVTTGAPDTDPDTGFMTWTLDGATAPCSG